MTYIVHIKHNKTGEVRKITFAEPQHEFSEFLWSEGNDECDCNRHGYFTGSFIHKFPCGDTEYSVVDVTDENGERTEEMKIFLGIDHENGI